MSFLAQVASAFVGTFVAGVALDVLATGHLPKTIRSVPWWVWLATLAAVCTVIAVTLVRRRNMKTVRFGHIPFPNDSDDQWDRL